MGRLTLPASWYFFSGRCSYAGLGRSSRFCMSGLFGVRIIWPFFLNVMPLILWRCLVLDFGMVFASSSRVCSPSPRTMMSTSGFSLSISLSMKVACGPPRMMGVSGFASFAECAAMRADSIMGVKVVMPTASGLDSPILVLNSL